ncbi:hypothetical protein BDW22DRAFT_1227644 [Trametopsis cervina]|nr:hypothetical protein BDW22DRAFT_1227644 [Trametopsis cervina]
MLPRWSKGISKPLEATQPPLLRNALPFEILSIIFDCVAQSFSARKSHLEFNAPNYSGHRMCFNQAGYTESEAAYKTCLISLALVCRRWHAAAHPHLLPFLCYTSDQALQQKLALGPRGSWHCTK